MLAEPENGRLLKATQEQPEGFEIEVPELAAHQRQPIAHFLHGIETDEAFHPLCRAGHCRDAQEILSLGAQAAESGQQIELPQLKEVDYAGGLHYRDRRAGADPSGRTAQPQT